VSIHLMLLSPIYFLPRPLFGSFSLFVNFYTDVILGWQGIVLFLVMSLVLVECLVVKHGEGVGYLFRFFFFF